MNFQAEHADDIGDKAGQAGQDFYLTRNRHGAGFWDSNWPNDVGQRLTKASHTYGTFALVCDDDDGPITHHN